MSRQQEQRRAAREARERAQAESLVRSFWVREPAGAGRYAVRDLLGKGQFGTVVRARSCDCSPRDVAIKRVDHVFANPGDAVRTIRELRFLREFSGHPNIVRLKDVLVPSQPTAFDTVYFVTSLMTTDLRQMISSKTTLEDKQLRWLMYQLLRGLSHIHGANVVHRDIKPANIVVDKHCNLKLCDFGLARAIFPEHKQASDAPFTDYVATRWYRAPELLCAKPQWQSAAGDSRSYTTQIDLWAAGAVLGEMLLRRPLFRGASTYGQLELIVSYTGTPADEVIARVPNTAAREFLRQRQRPSADSASMFPSLAEDGQSVLRGLLTFEPSKRIDAASSLLSPFFSSIRETIDERLIPSPPQLRPQDFAWEDESLPTAELRRALYEEIEDYHLQAGMREPESPSRPEAQPPRRSPMLTATSSREEQWGHLIDAGAESAEPRPPSLDASDSELSEPISIVSDHTRTSPTMPPMDECEEDSDSPRSFTAAKPQPPSLAPSKPLMSSGVVLETASVASEAARPESPDAPARVVAQPSSRSGGGWRCCMRPDRCA